MDERLELTRQNWNERTPIHFESDFYDVPGFLAGKISLTSIEIDEMGSVEGKSLLHLQCHFGMDTMSWARLGARATGVDISDVAIDKARYLNTELGLDVRFIRSNLYDLPRVLDEQFDIVYTAIGAICWLPDLTQWAKLIRRYLKPGGKFYILDGHPSSHVFEPVQDAAGKHELKLAYSYFPDDAGLYDAGERHTYAGSQLITTPVYEWQHSLAEIVNSLVQAGLTIQQLNEFPFAAFQAYPNMRKGDDGWWRLDQHHGSVPFMFSIKATK